MRCVVFVALFIVVCVHHGAVASTQTLIDALQREAAVQTNIFGASIVAQSLLSASTMGPITSASYGVQSPATQLPFFPDTPIRANSGVGELSVAVLVQTLVNSQVLPQLDSSIPTRLLPGGIQVINPAFPGIPVTLRMLLTHTSSLIDNVNILTSPTLSGGSNAQVDLRSYAEGYFINSQTLTKSISTDIWNSMQPGLASSFQYAKANIVLLSYILEQIIAENPTFVKSTAKTVAAYITEAIWAPLGMIDTFIVLPDGSLPRSGLNSVFAGKVASETNSAGTVVSTVPLYAGYTADFMIRSSASDVNKLMRALFMDSQSAFYAVGSQLIASMISVTDTVRVGVIKQGFGVVGVDGVAMCASAGAVLALPAGCSVLSSNIIGIYGVGTNSALTSTCTTNPLTSVMTCTTAAIVYHPSGSMTASKTSFVAHAAAFNDIFIDQTVSEGVTVTPATQAPTALFGFEVFLGVLGSVLGVLFMAYSGEYILQPVPLIGTMSNNAYPTLNEHVDRSVAVLQRGQKDLSSF